MKNYETFQYLYILENTIQIKYIVIVIIVGFFYSKTNTFEAAKII